MNLHKDIEATDPRDISNGAATWAPHGEADYRPRTGKAEWHLTYACDLECSGCNRASFLREPHTPQMTLDDAHEFIRQADALDWRPRITIIGGEPTLHPDFPELVDLAREFSRQMPQVWSNGYGRHAKDALQQIRRRAGADIVAETMKLEGSVTSRDGVRGWVDDIYVSPTDLGKPLRAPCYQHASVICGVSVDHAGYSPCAMGGGIDAVLGLKVRTKRLADLFDRVKVAKMTADLCRHCGQQASVQNFIEPAAVAACETRFGTPMSKTWLRAFEGRR